MVCATAACEAMEARTGGKLTWFRFLSHGLVNIGFASMIRFQTSVAEGLIRRRLSFLETLRGHQGLTKSLKGNNRDKKISFQRTEYSRNCQNWWPGREIVIIEIDFQATAEWP